MTLKTLAIIPARGGSKSIPKKNISMFCGKALMAYAVEAAKHTTGIDELVCSTDDNEIADVATSLGVEVLWRPEELGRDETNIVDVLKYHLLDREDVDFVPLLQPTSPFLLPEHIEACIQGLKTFSDADSAQTITRFPPNHHAFNQRVIENGRVRFYFQNQRRILYNKQLKPDFFVYGNLVVTRRLTVMQNEVFGNNSVPIEIAPAYAFDLDGPEDVAYGEYLVRTGAVTTPWLGQSNS